MAMHQTPARHSAGSMPRRPRELCALEAGWEQGQQAVRWERQAGWPAGLHRASPLTVQAWSGSISSPPHPTPSETREVVGPDRFHNGKVVRALHPLPVGTASVIHAGPEDWPRSWGSAVYRSARAATPRLKQQHFLSPVLEAGIRDPGVGRADPS